MNEQYFENISSIEELIIAERNGFNIEFKTNRPEMPGATLIHESARKCNTELLTYLISDRNLDVNQLDEDQCTPLGYVVNDDLIYEIKSGCVTTVNEGCDNAFTILETIHVLLTNGAVCMYNGAVYENGWVNNYILELKKQL